MKMTTIEIENGEVTLDLNSISTVCKENASSSLMGDYFPEKFFFIAQEKKYYLKEYQYKELMSLLVPCS